MSHCFSSFYGLPDPGRARNEMMDGVLEDLLPNFNAATRLKELE